MTELITMFLTRYVIVKFTDPQNNIYIIHILSGNKMYRVFLFTHNMQHLLCWKTSLGFLNLCSFYMIFNTYINVIVKKTLILFSLFF